MNHRAFAKIWIIVILVVLIAGGILAWRYLETPKGEIKPPEEVATDETSDWKTYRNEEYGFEFKHPSFFVFEKQKEEILPLPLESFSLNFVLPDYPDLEYGAWGGVGIYNAKDYGVYMYEEMGYIVYDIVTRKWYVTDQHGIGQFDPSLAKKVREYSPKIHVFTKDKIPVYGDFWFTDVGVSAKSYSIVYNKKQLIIEFFFGFDYNQLDLIEPDPEKYDQLVKDITQSFNQMLSSFRFLE